MIYPGCIFKKKLLPPLLSNVLRNSAQPLTVKCLQLSAMIIVKCWHLHLSRPLGAFQIHMILWCISHLEPLSVNVNVSVAFWNASSIDEYIDSMYVYAQCFIDVMFFWTISTCDVKIQYCKNAILNEGTVKVQSEKLKWKMWHWRIICTA